MGIASLSFPLSAELRVEKGSNCFCRQVSMAPLYISSKVYLNRNPISISFFDEKDTMGKSLSIPLNLLFYQIELPSHHSMKEPSILRNTEEQRGLLSRNIVLWPFLSHHLSHIVDDSMMGRANESSLCLGVLIQEYMSLTKIIQMHILTLFNDAVVSFIPCTSLSD